MNLTRALGAAFGVDPTRFEAIVDAYESPGIVLPPADRLELIERRHAEAGGGDGDKGWLIAEVKRLKSGLDAIMGGRSYCPVYGNYLADGVLGHKASCRLLEALNSGRGVYQP